MPSKQLLSNSPMEDVTLGGDNSCFTSDNEKDLESTEDSQTKMTDDFGCSQ